MTAPARVEVIGWQSEIPGWNLPDPDETNWRDQALCAQVDGDLWFPEPGGAQTDAKRICRACPVRSQCLAAVLAAPGPPMHGVWAGLAVRDIIREWRQTPRRAVDQIIADSDHLDRIRGQRRRKHLAAANETAAAARAARAAESRAGRSLAA